MTNPFAHHPELRDQITPADRSFFRDFNTDKLQRVLEDQGLEPFPCYAEDEREAMRADALAGRRDGDLWVFAYGSLMWDPALEFTEVRRAFAPHHARRFILRDIYGGRGTRDAPGLMAALDIGAGCAGLAFRIPKDRIEPETTILFRRELLGPAYFATFLPLDIDGVRVDVLSFVADHDAELIAADLTREEQIAYLLTGTGFLGSSYDYMANVITHLHEMGIPDPELDALMADVDARRSATG